MGTFKGVVEDGDDLDPMTTDDVSTLSHIQALLGAIASGQEPGEQIVLLSQLNLIERASGPITMLKLAFSASPRLLLKQADGPIKGRVIVLSEREEVGELILSVKGGRADTLEFAWWTDVPPTSLPARDELIIS
ncbi:hypothetical protein [uncultured Amnibacterium sp.]|uniref:hypothetical protein n=1 Tax=uncultured Amnibacterium sp. TaxID=1631851 RepID=UPI0035CAE02E